MVIGVNVRDTASVAQVNDTGGGVVDKDVNGRQGEGGAGRRSVAAARSRCRWAMRRGSTSR